MNATGADAQAESLYGTCQLLSNTRELVATGERVDIFGQAPQGFITYGRAGRMSAIIVGDNRPKPPDLAKLTDQERAELFRTMAAYAGTFKVLHHVDVSWNANWTGSVQVRSFRQEGRQLIITSGPQIGPDGREVIAVLTWEKVG
jgi:hypothetical protein